jgi:hypothetical protein
LLNLERRNPALGGGAPTGANRIGDTAVLKYRPTETPPCISAMLLDLCVSADRAVWHPSHTGAKPGLFRERRRNLERDGLFAGGEWIRTISSARADTDVHMRISASKRLVDLVGGR